MDHLFYEFLQSSHLSWFLYLVLLSGGIIAFFNPCMLGMVPLLIGHMGNRNYSSRWYSLALTTLFTLGFLVSLVFLVSIFTSFYQLAQRWASWWPNIMGTLYFVLFLHLWGYSPLRTAMRFLPTVVGFYQSPFTVPPSWSAFVLGLFFGLTPSPCTTPLALAVTTALIPAYGYLKGLSMILTYGFGHSLPLALIALVSLNLSPLRHLQRSSGFLKKATALFLLFLSIYFYFFM
ncbi:cytochrome c biogenesis CcdA family protein [Calderihabitans maritimus]|uniref:Cytochrome c biogenesis protein transmembrane region n=1 Tax=Calderihabitans maritimus TaxID=1246530 RepID=A0A1Z5HVL4_9FIRM|nr:cytochrome c biogenesis protein CcdA [Calderihabitans maritimus]GAW93355.1 cytochrome c biogenesis protein transmembrane region [Calderihabitans maritimus]